MVEQDHGPVRRDLANLIINSPKRVMVRTSDNTELSLSRELLILFSPVIRNIISDITFCCSFPTIYFPDIPTTTILSIRNIIEKSMQGYPLVSFNGNLYNILIKSFFRKMLKMLMFLQLLLLLALI